MCPFQSFPRAKSYFTGWGLLKQKSNKYYYYFICYTPRPIKRAVQTLHCVHILYIGLRKSPTTLTSELINKFFTYQNSRDIGKGSSNNGKYHRSQDRGKHEVPCAMLEKDKVYSGVWMNTVAYWLLPSRFLSMKAIY